MAQLITVRRASTTNIVVHLRGKPASGGNRAVRGIYVLGDPFRLPASLEVQIPVEDLVGNPTLAGDIQRYLDAGFVTAFGPDGTAITGVLDYVNPPLQVYSDANRPAASKFFRGQSIWNTTDNDINTSDGTDWRLNGAVT